MAFIVTATLSCDLPRLFCWMNLLLCVCVLLVGGGEGGRRGLWYIVVGCVRTGSIRYPACSKRCAGLCVCVCNVVAFLLRFP